MMMIMMMMFSLSAPAYLTGHGGILHGYQNRLLPALEVSSMYNTEVQIRLILLRGLPPAAIPRFPTNRKTMLPQVSYN